MFIISIFLIIIILKMLCYAKYYNWNSTLFLFNMTVIVSNSFAFIWVQNWKDCTSWQMEILALFWVFSFKNLTVYHIKFSTTLANYILTAIINWFRENRFNTYFSSWLTRLLIFCLIIDCAYLFDHFTTLYFRRHESKAFHKI